MTGDSTGGLTRRRVLAATAASAVAGGFAGCNGDDGGDGDSAEPGVGSDSTGESDGNADGASGDSANGSPPGLVTIDVDGELVENGVDGIDVVDHQAYEADGHDMVADGAFSLMVTVENTGESETEPQEYTYEVSLFDESDELIDDGYSGRPHDYGLPPGETAEMEAWGGSGGQAEAVARYELVLSCASQSDDGVYCG